MNFKKVYNLISEHIEDKTTILEKIKLLEKKSKKTSRILLHKNSQSKLHIMLIRHEKSYRGDPFKYKNKKIKFFILLSGSAKFVFYNGKGNIVEIKNFSRNRNMIILDESKYFYHQIIYSKSIVFFEITSGPFIKKDKKFLYKFVKNFPTTKNYFQFDAKIKNSLINFSKT